MRKEEFAVPVGGFTASNTTGPRRNGAGVDGFSSVFICCESSVPGRLAKIFLTGFCESKDAPALVDEARWRKGDPTSWKQAADAVSGESPIALRESSIRPGDSVVALKEGGRQALMSQDAGKEGEVRAGTLHACRCHPSRASLRGKVAHPPHQGRSRPQFPNRARQATRI